MGRIINTNISESLSALAALGKLINDQPTLVLLKVQGHYAIGTEHDQFSFQWTEASGREIVGGQFAPPMLRETNKPVFALPAKVGFDLISMSDDLDQCIQNAVKWFALPLEERRPFLPG